MNHQESERMRRIETLVGDTPDEGLRGDAKAIREDITAIKDSIKGMEKHLYTAMGAAAVVFWLLNTAVNFIKS